MHWPLAISVSKVILRIDLIINCSSFPSPRMNFEIKLKCKVSLEWKETGKVFNIEVFSRGDKNGVARVTLQITTTHQLQ